MFYYSFETDNSTLPPVDGKTRIDPRQTLHENCENRDSFAGRERLNRAARITTAGTVGIQRFSTALLLNLTSRYLYAGESCFRRGITSCLHEKITRSRELQRSFPPLRRDAGENDF